MNYEYSSEIRTIGPSEVSPACITLWSFFPFTLFLLPACSLWLLCVGIQRKNDALATEHCTFCKTVESLGPERKWKAVAKQFSTWTEHEVQVKEGANPVFLQQQNYRNSTRAESCLMLWLSSLPFSVCLPSLSWRKNYSKISTFQLSFGLFSEKSSNF